MGNERSRDAWTTKGPARDEAPRGVAGGKSRVGGVFVVTILVAVCLWAILWNQDVGTGPAIAPDSVEVAATPESAVRLQPVVDPAGQADLAGEGARPARRAAEDLAPGFELVVRGPAGRPVPGARVALYRGAVVLAHGMTDREGTYVPELPQVGEARAFVWPREYPPHLTEVVLEGRVELDLPAGVTVGGVVRVDGGLPPEPLDLEVHWGDGGKSGFARVPDAVFAALGRPRSELAIHRTRTGTGGRFHLTGLREGCSGGVLWPAPYFLEGVEGAEPLAEWSKRIARSPAAWAWDETRMVQVFAPNTEIDLRLRAPGRIHGRLFTRVGGVPVRQGEVSLAWKHDGGVAVRTESTRPDGSFAFSVRRPVPTPLRLSVSDGDERGPRRSTLEVEDPMAPEIDLGDLVLDPEATLAVRVVDELGTPLRGCQVSFEVEDPVDRSGFGGPPLDRSAPLTDVAGRTDLALSHRASFLRVVKPGYAPAHLPRPADPGGSVEVVLERACVLRVRLVSPTEDVEDLRLRLSGAPRIFAHGGTVEPVDFGMAEGELDAVPEWGGVGPTEILYDPQEHGRFDLSGLMPNTPLRLEAKTREGRVAGVLDLAPLQPGEWRSIDLHVEPERGHLRLEVVDIQGMGIEGARVSLGGRTLHTGVGGRLDLPDLVVGPLEITVSHPDFRSRETTRTMGPAGLELRVVLLRP